LESGGAIKACPENIERRSSFKGVVGWGGGLGRGGGVVCGRGVVKELWGGLRRKRMSNGVRVGETS